MNRHQGNPVPLFFKSRLAAQFIPFGHITDELQKHRKAVEPFRRGFQLIKHFFQHFPVERGLMPIIGLDEIVIEA
ncbi:hypothetical protein D3C75_741910 [compost metagenome]